MRSLLRSGLVLVLLSVATACGEDGGPDPSSEGFQEWMADDAAEWAYWLTGQAVGLISGEEDPLDAPPFTGRAGARSSRQLPATALPRLSRTALFSNVHAAIEQGCTITATGTGEGPWDPYDGNHNGIPDDYHLKLDCFHVIDSITNATFRQRQEVRVKERVGEDYGLDLTESYFYRWEVDGELDEETKSDRTMRISRIDMHGTIDWTSAYRYTEGGESPNWYGDREEAHGELFGEEFDLPMVRGAPPASANRDIPDGEFRLTGRIEYTDSDDADFAFDLSTPIPLEVDGYCAWDVGQVFTGGALLALFHGDPERGFGLTFNDCEGGADFFIFGEDEEGPPAVRPFVPRIR